jgi:hypothetical protein
MKAGTQPTREEDLMEEREDDDYFPNHNFPEEPPEDKTPWALRLEAEEHGYVGAENLMSRAEVTCAHDLDIWECSSCRD